MRILIVFLAVFVLGCASSQSKRNADKTKSTQTTASGASEEGLSNMDLSEEEGKEEIKAAESEEDVYWKEVDAMRLPDMVTRVELTDFEAYQCTYEVLMARLSEESPTIMVPTLQGLQRFNLENSSTMNPALAARFPAIKSFQGKSEDGKLSIRLDTNEEGLFAEISGPQIKELIAPLFSGSVNYYALYLEGALPPPTRDASFD